MNSSGERFCAIICTKSSNPEAVGRLQKLRKALFVDALAWPLATEGDREVDQFDTSYAVHCLILHNDVLVAGFRAVQGCYPYLAATVFPHMATAQPFPGGPLVWEISRFGVHPEFANTQLAKLTYSVMLRFGHARGAVSLVALVDLCHERLLRKLGVFTRRYGDPAVVGVDRSGRNLAAVAGEIPIREQSSDGYYSLIRMSDTVEIIDETLVLGRFALSA